MTTLSDLIVQQGTPRPAPPAPPSESLGDSYMAYRDQAGAQAGYERELARLSSGQTEQQAPTEQPPGKANIGQAGAYAPVGRALRDIGRGSFESPKQMLGGARDAVQSTLNGARDLGDWLEKKTGAPGLRIDSSGIHVLSADELARSSSSRPFEGSPQLPTVDAPSTTTGGVVRSAAQFITAMASVSRTLGLGPTAAGIAGRLQTMGKGALALFTGFNGAQGRLSDLMQSVPALQNPVSEFLSTKPTDNEAVGRLKNAVEGVGVGTVADGLVHALRFLRGGLAAEKAAQTLPDGPIAPEAPATPSALQTLGDATEKSDTPIATVEPATAKLPAAEASVEKSGLTPAQVGEMREPAINPDDYGVQEVPGRGFAVYDKNGKAASQLFPTAQAARDELDAVLRENKLAGPASPGATAAQAKEPKVYINFNRIDAPDDIKRAQSELAGAFKDDIDAARRGVQSWNDTRLGAAGVDAWNTLMSRRTGEVLNDAETLAARQLWISSTTKLLEVTDMADAAPTPENLFAFRKMFATHAAIQQETLGARAESARSFGSWRITAGPEDYRMQQIAEALSQDTGLRQGLGLTGGLNTAADMLARVKAIAKAGDLTALNDFTQKSAYAKTRDAVLEAWTNGLLTAAMTHIKVPLSNTVMMAMRVSERAVAARIGQLLGDQSGVQLGEASAQMAAIIGGTKDALRFAGKASVSYLQDGKAPQLGDDPLSNAIKAFSTGQYSTAGGTAPELSRGAISSQALGIADSGWLGKGVDLLGQVVRAPGRALTAEHDFFRSIGYRMELNAVATRTAIQEANAGTISRDGVAARIADIVANPPDSVHAAAVDGMLYQTWTNAPGKIAGIIEQVRTEFPATRVIVPFYRIPSQILSTQLERSPLAPLMSKFRADIAAGGARQQLATAQIGLGLMVTLATVDHVLSGQTTGSGPLEHGTRMAMSNEGWQPYSTKVGDRWFQYNRLEPVGGNIGMTADAVEAMLHFHSAVNADDPDVSDLAFATVMAVAQDVTSKQYLQGLAHFFETMASPKTEGERALQSLAGSFVPAGVASIAHVQDPTKRAVYSMIDAIKARTPGQSSSLPPVRNLWGEPVKTSSGLGAAFDLLSPIGTRQPANEPIDKELLRLGANISLPPSRVSLNGETVDLKQDPKLYSRYVQLAGNEPLPGLGMGAKDLLNAVVTGNHPLSSVYNAFGPKGDGPDGPKAEFIKGIIQESRTNARQQLLQESHVLQKQVDDKQRLRLESLLP